MAATRVAHFVLTLSGAADQLPQHDALREIHIQPFAANTGAVFVGGPGVTTTDYGVRLPAPAAGVPPPPWIFGPHPTHALKSSDLYVIGTAGEKLAVLVVVYNP